MSWTSQFLAVSHAKIRVTHYQPAEYIVNSDMPADLVVYLERNHIKNKKRDDFYGDEYFRVQCVSV